MSDTPISDMADQMREAAYARATVNDDSGWDHPPPPGTVKMKCCRCTLWFSCRDGIEMCPICRTIPSITSRRFLQKRK